jgi:two-component system, OmpR family, phosphate regulon sensor histidine kinase PhoR
MTAAATPAKAGSARPPLLVVDDEPGMRAGMKRTLERRGYPATAAGSGVEALEALAAQPIPIVLVDLRMPGMDGFELIEHIRRERPETICIVVSAFATIEAAVQTTKMGAFDFVVKPFLPDDLLRVVDRAAEKWSLEREAARLRTEREVQLLELADEKSRLRTILQSMGQGLLVVNLDGDVVLDNPEARRLLDRVAAPPGARPPVAELLDAPAFLDLVHTLAHGDAPEQALELDVRRPSGAGKERVLRATLAPVRDEAGRARGVVVLLADVTEARAFERARSQFVSMVAHEVKAPIAAVESYLHLILDGTLDSQPERARQALRRCLERTGALVALVHDLLEITRRESPTCERHLEPLDLAALASELGQFHAELARGRGVEIVVAAPAGLPRVLADRQEIERVLTNLLSNAVKYNRDGGKVLVSLATRGGALVLEVRDTGIGMSEEERARLGEEFFRAKNPRTRAITGTGLGVALVRRIVESYRGSLEVESAPESGSAFRVLLPIGAERSGGGVAA